MGCAFAPGKHSFSLGLFTEVWFHLRPSYPNQEDIPASNLELRYLREVFQPSTLDRRIPNGVSNNIGYQLYSPADHEP